MLQNWDFRNKLTVWKQVIALYGVQVSAFLLFKARILVFFGKCKLTYLFEVPSPRRSWRFEFVDHFRSLSADAHGSYTEWTSVRSKNNPAGKCAGHVLVKRYILRATTWSVSACIIRVFRARAEHAHGVRNFQIFHLLLAWNDTRYHLLCCLQPPSLLLCLFFVCGACVGG